MLFFLAGQKPDCYNSCEDVRDTYRNKCWDFMNPDLIDQVGANKKVSHLIGLKFQIYGL